MTNGERLKFLREKKGLTQKEVATRLGLEPAAVSKYELDMREPNIEAIKKLANDHLSGWTIDRLSKVDKAILEIGIFELMYTKTPSVVSINEAIELSKQYSDEKVTKMINACLDKIYHENEGKIDEQ